MELYKTLVKTTSIMFASSKQNKLPKITNELLLTPAHKLSAQIKDGSLTSVELCEAFADRIKQVQPLINAMTQDRFKEALEEARRIDNLLASFRSGKPESEFTSEELEMLRSPLLGVPVSVKESVMVKGMRNTCGLWVRRDVNATCDAVVIKNARRFGLIPLCMTNVPECTLFWADCQNKIYGRSANPYDLSRITGASSGGEGSLLGAAGSVVGIGSDIGGSLRIPAHYCGIYSHKPSPFLCSPEGNYPEIQEHRMRLFTLGPMCRYASDLRPMLKFLISDKDNSKQDTYYEYQPKDIASIRKQVAQKLDEPVDLSQVKLYYFNFNTDSQLKGKQSIHVREEFMDAQQEVIDHFRSKFNCQAETINLDKFFHKALITWQCMLQGGGTGDGSQYVEDELKKAFGIDNMLIEALKMPFGLSKHTKESLLTLVLGSTIPKDREKAIALCERFEKFGADLRAEFAEKLGDNGVLMMPTLPTLAYKFNVSLMKTADIRFPCLFNILQVPVTHATMRLDKKCKLPFGFSFATKQYNDSVTISIAEEVEATFGGWTQPSLTQASSLNAKSPTTAMADKSERAVNLSASNGTGIINESGVNTTNARVVVA